MPILSYRCPTTGSNEEVWYEIDDDPREAADALLETVVCRSCGEVHLVDPKRSKVVGKGEV